MIQGRFNIGDEVYVKISGDHSGNLCNFFAIIVEDGKRNACICGDSIFIKAL